MFVDRHSQQFNVVLPSNPTTGYQWSIKHYDNAFLKLINSQYIAKQPKLIGSGGETHFSFSWAQGVKHLKSTTMVFRYARSWEHGGGQTKKVVVIFR